MGHSNSKKSKFFESVKLKAKAGVFWTATLYFKITAESHCHFYRSK